MQTKAWVLRTVVAVALVFAAGVVQMLHAADKGGATKTAEVKEAPAVGAEDARIEASDPVRKNKPKAHWKDRARIVGRLRNAPEAEATVLTADGKVIKSVRITAGAKAYEMEWLAPGVYTLRVEAKGYQPLLLQKLEVGANQDLWVSLEF